MFKETGRATATASFPVNLAFAFYIVPYGTLLNVNLKCW